MPPDFRGKVALITGVGRVGQIGHAVARGFGRAGAQLVIADVNAAGLRPQSQLAAYTAAKAAVAGLTRALAKELRDDGIRVNAVAPGTMKTADNLAQMSGAKVRWVELDELAAAVLYLASDDARGVNGEILAVTGRDV